MNGKKMTPPLSVLKVILLINTYILIIIPTQIYFKCETNLKIRIAGEVNSLKNKLKDLHSSG